MHSSIIFQSIIAGLATAFGALFVLFIQKPSERLLASLLGFAGGIMTSVVLFDLIPSAIDYGNLFVTALGFLLGLLFMLIVDMLISSISGLRKNQTQNRNNNLLKMGYLIAIGIALHDLPEGIAIAVGYTAQESLGFLIALSIGLHNIPEGIAVAAPLFMSGMSKFRILLITLIISIFTPLGTYIGILLMLISPKLICILLALAAGAMIYIVKKELIPESIKYYPTYAKLGFIIGLIFIILLNLFHH